MYSRVRFHNSYFSPAPEQKQFIAGMIRSGQFNVEDDVVSEALRRMAAADLEFLAPPPLTAAQIGRIYGPNAEEDEREARIGRAAFAAVRRAAHRVTAC